VTASTFELWAAVRPSYPPDAWRVVNPNRDTGTASAHVANVELTHLPPEGRADAAAAGAA
jgi:hypothetical protein